MTVTAEFLDFLAGSPSSFHAAQLVADQLSNAGFASVTENEAFPFRTGGTVMLREGAVIAWWIPENASPESGFRIVGSHTDSPGFSLKPHPSREAAGWRQAAVEVYGGPILDSWFDRELAFAGMIALSDGSTRLISTGPIARIPRLAIHLDRRTEFAPDRQIHLQPIYGAGDGPHLLEVIAETAGVAVEDILGHQLISVDTQPGSVFGVDSDLLASGRLDNLTSVFASLSALRAATSSGLQGDDILVLAAFDHEEVGSNSPTGAAGPLLSRILRRIATGLGATEEQWYQMLARSTMVSADAAHSVHPNYAEKHDPTHHPIINGGPVIKVNANQRYASTARTTALWRRACAAAGVPSQDFVANNAVPCGSTIGPITATRVGIDTVDVGVPLLSMHSARELAGTHDLAWFTQALEAYYRNV